MKIPCINWQGRHLNIHYTMSPTLVLVWSVVYIMKGVVWINLSVDSPCPMDWLLFPHHPNNPETRLPLVQKVFLGSWLHFCRFLLSARTTSSILSTVSTRVSLALPPIFSCHDHHPLRRVDRLRTTFFRAQLDELYS